jgi:hypothetical protein
MKLEFGMKECEPPYKIVFQPEKRVIVKGIGRPVPDTKHEEFVECLTKSYKEGYLSKAELDRRNPSGETHYRNH